MKEMLIKSESWQYFSGNTPKQEVLKGDPQNIMS